MDDHILGYYSLQQAGNIVGGLAAETIRGWIWSDRKKVLDGEWEPDDDRIRFPNYSRNRIPVRDILAYTGLTPELLAMIDPDLPARQPA